MYLIMVWLAMRWSSVVEFVRVIITIARDTAYTPCLPYRVPAVEMIRVAVPCIVVKCYRRIAAGHTSITRLMVDWSWLTDNNKRPTISTVNTLLSLIQHFQANVTTIICAFSRYKIFIIYLFFDICWRHICFTEAKVHFDFVFQCCAWI